MAREYDHDVSIDEHNLVHEWLRQPMLVLRYGVAYAEANEERDRAKDNMDVVQASLDEQVRRKLNQRGGKVTEAKVKAAILMEPEYAEAMTRIQEANRRLGELAAVRDALGHRQKALDGITRLKLSVLYSDNEPPRKLQEADEAGVQDGHREVLGRNPRLKRLKPRTGAKE